MKSVLWVAPCPVNISTCISHMFSVFCLCCKKISFLTLKKYMKNACRYFFLQDIFGRVASLYKVYTTVLSVPKNIANR